MVSEAVTGNQELVSQRVRQAAPESVRRMGRRAASAYGRSTSRWRALPDFIMVGAQRAGTTSLFRALMSHPQVARPTTMKGVNYFDLDYVRGPRWYRGHFPVARTTAWRTRAAGPPAVFEASGYYLYHPVAVERIARDLPDVRLVVMLRDPVERSYSAYQHERARGFEWESFETALRLEDTRLVGEVDRMRRDPAYESFPHRHHSYLHRSRYAEQLERVFAHVPRDQVHVMMSEEYFADPAGEFRALTSFLGLVDSPRVTFERYNAQPRAALDERIRAELRDHFAPHDERLAELLGRGLPWRDERGREAA